MADQETVEQIPDAPGLEEFQDMLEKRVLEWNEELREEGRQEGREEGRREGEATLLLRLLKLKFGPLEEETRSRVLSADPERLLEWGERILTARHLSDIFGD
jgi:predicted transposase YdaD